MTCASATRGQDSHRRLVSERNTSSWVRCRSATLAPSERRDPAIAKGNLRSGASVLRPAGVWTAARRYRLRQLPTRFGPVGRRPAAMKAPGIGSYAAVGPRSGPAIKQAMRLPAAGANRVRGLPQTATLASPALGNRVWTEADSRRHGPSAFVTTRRLAACSIAGGLRAELCGKARTKTVETPLLRTLDRHLRHNSTNLQTTPPANNGE
jgi:hypothetical protein